ncbi:RagB/SusD family nutrient uptake outer membrane protein [Hymenobacter sp. AT01-02]|uniref:RagB/SusD family nutrient uptake outer membrane protein n=1 Tax=Hymenobacter sp. AT01-02 TaxID=1571877 RepID=UPI0005F0F1EE|nr:RagB/SusD family nutrient uptake outer membrane protein [Hymenobacter sp. AT01-02]
MKFRSKLSTIATLGLLAFSASSCSDFLDPTPQVSVDRNDVFTDAAGARGAIVGVYGALTSADYLGLYYPLLADLAADNLAHTGTFPQLAQVKTRNIISDNVTLTNVYYAIYRAINRANNVIANVPNVTGLSDAEKNSIIAEALFIRAYCHFDVTRFWGDAALSLTPTSTPDNSLFVSRSTKEQVYAQVIADLTQALPNLPDTGTGRATKSAAQALIARVQLYAGKWKEAETAADLIISSNRFQLTPSYATNFTSENSTESILEVQFDANTQSQFAFFNLPTANGGRNEVNPIGPGSTLTTSYETGDTRRNATISDGTTIISNRAVVAGTGIKYKDPGTGTDNYKMFRFAEILLIGAEAKAQLQDITGSLALLNRVRTRAGLPIIAATGLNQAGLLAAIAQERRIELALEGHRWFDLVRTNQAQTVLGIADPTRLLFPIPLREIQNNPNMKQNTGY